MQSLDALHIAFLYGFCYRGADRICMAMWLKRWTTIQPRRCSSVKEKKRKQRKAEESVAGALQSAPASW